MALLPAWAAITDKVRVGILVSKIIYFRGAPVEGRGGQQVLVEDPSGNVVELFESTR